jgi:hypothetical protein
MIAKQKANARPRRLRELAQTRSCRITGDDVRCLRQRLVQISAADASRLHCRFGDMNRICCNCPFAIFYGDRLSFNCGHEIYTAILA